jgi:lipoprotein signal peptidase
MQRAAFARSGAPMLVELLLSAAIVFGLDQGSKLLVAERAGPDGEAGFGPLRLCYVVTEGYGLRLIGDRRALVALWIIAVVGCLAVALLGPAADLAISRIGLGAAIGGSASNLVDRLRYGTAVDIVRLRGWSVFNLADVAIILGVLVTVCAIVSALHGGG